MKQRKNNNPSIFLIELIKNIRNITAVEFVPQLCTKLKRDNPLMTGPEIRQIVITNLLPIWKENTIRNCLPEWLKNPNHIKAAKTRYIRQREKSLIEF
jgi:hypothetical protein